MDSTQGPVIDTGGQVDLTPEGATVSTPAVSTGQAAATQQGQAPAAPATPEEPSFFDPSTLTPELMPAYKQMQASFTKKMQALSGDRQKIEAYNAFMSDPIGQMQQVARQYGYSLTRAEAAAAMNQGQQGQTQQQWEPQSWDEVISRTKAETREELMRELAPFLGNVQKVTAQNIERQLQEIDPNWVEYQDEIRANLAEYPNLVNNVGKLYRLSVPDEVYQRKATQEAIKRLQGKAQAAQIGDKSQTSRSQPAPRKATSFAEAVEIAKANLAEQGR